MGKKRVGIGQLLERHTEPQAVVRALMKAGQVKKKCCRSKSRCKKCPVLALKKVKRKQAKRLLRETQQETRPAVLEPAA